MKLISTNPAKNYEVIGEVEVSTQEEITQKVAAAKKAHVAWAELPLKERIAAVLSFGKEAEKRRDDLAKIMTLETGRPLKTSYSNVQDGLDYLAAYTEMAEEYLAPKVVFEDDKNIHTAYREPWGVVACISPWNFPFQNVVWAVVPPLLAGNTVVFKNSEEDPLFSTIIEEIITASHLPDGVLSIIYGSGEVGDMLAHADVNMIRFTGSTKTGQYLYKVAGEKFIPAHMELGGSSPGVVCADTNVDAVIEAIYLARFDNSGQYCDGLKRLIVHESRFDEVVEKLTKVIATKKVGDPFAESTDLGPLVAKRQLKLLESQVQDAIEKGAKVEIGGKQPEGLEGAYYLPTLLTNITKDMRVWKEEVFGPVLPVVTFSSEEEAVALANDTQYGLSAYIYTENQETFKRVAATIQSGLISWNNVNPFSPYTPFGGYKKSGIGRQNGEYGFADVTQVKVLAEEK